MALSLNTVQIPRPDDSAVAKVSLPDWRTKRPLEPFYDPTTNEYVVVVMSEDATTDNVFVQKEKAKLKALDFLMRWFDKKLESKDKLGKKVKPEILVEDGQILRIPAGYEGWHLDPRPGSKLKFQVRIRAEFFRF